MWRESRFVPIRECGEALVPIPRDRFSVVRPHPYQAAGAPYGNRSPYFLRESVLRRLVQAQGRLDGSGWRILVFDAYRPVAVQRYMVDHTLAQLAAERGHRPDALSAEHRRELLDLVHKFWAVPSDDPATPPPHSTGAAMDITLIDTHGLVCDMGGNIDEISERSWPDYYADDTSTLGQLHHRNRLRLRDAMAAAGFEQHPNEWWHFSFGDQLWAWLIEQRSGAPGQAVYGGVGTD
jgi:D-alanyl-D-alanine dipeptidase